MQETLHAASRRALLTSLSAASGGLFRAWRCAFSGDAVPRGVASGCGSQPDAAASAALQQCRAWSRSRRRGIFRLAGSFSFFDSSSVARGFDASGGLPFLLARVDFVDSRKGVWQASFIHGIRPVPVIQYFRPQTGEGAHAVRCPRLSRVAPASPLSQCRVGLRAEAGAPGLCLPPWPSQVQAEVPGVYATGNPANGPTPAGARGVRGLTPVAIVRVWPVRSQLALSLGLELVVQVSC